MGPYGLGRAPSPLMHTPSGCAYGCPAGAPIIGRDLFSFLRGRTSTRLRLVTGSNAPPKGWCICAPRRGAHYITRVRVCACARGTCRNFGQNSRSLGQNYRQGLFFFLAGSCGPSNPRRGYGYPYRGTHFQKVKANKF